MTDRGELARPPTTNGASNGSAPDVASRAPIVSVAEQVGRLGGETVKLGQKAAGALVSRLGRSIQGRLTADLDDRDPDYIRENLPLSWLIASIWYRAEVRNLKNVPEQGRVLMVGNHTGGNLSPETITITLAFCTYFGVERRFHQLAHNLVLASPLGPYLRNFGTVAASHANARKALEAEAAVLVFPGGDWEVHRPSWQSAKIDFGGRKGFIRLALERDAPIVPVVTIGGQETALWLDRGTWLAQLLRLDKTLRLKVLPILIAPPWGLTVGDFLPRLPLPAKITSEVLAPIDLRERFGEDPDIDEVYTYITDLMQETLDGLAAERRFPVIG
ncbi:MAG: 1-acyl-sn-glycerol-3-phosphate acyltransferase [Actinomycetota bacterium]|nr:1-acyl-sn-glycerol-3-phosphate acyltransferase [Actinomycetota bacterium]